MYFEKLRKICFGIQVMKKSEQMSLESKKLFKTKKDKKWKLKTTLYSKKIRHESYCVSCVSAKKKKKNIIKAFKTLKCLKK